MECQKLSVLTLAALNKRFFVILRRGQGCNLSRHFLIFNEVRKFRPFILKKEAQLAIILAVHSIIKTSPFFYWRTYYTYDNYGMQGTCCKERIRKLYRKERMILLFYKYVRSSYKLNVSTENIKEIGR